MPLDILVSPAPEPLNPWTPDPMVIGIMMLTRKNMCEQSKDLKDKDMCKIYSALIVKQVEYHTMQRHCIVVCIYLYIFKAVVRSVTGSRNNAWIRRCRNDGLRWYQKNARLACLDEKDHFAADWEVFGREVESFWRELEVKGIRVPGAKAQPVLQLRHLLLRTFLRPTSYLPTASLEQENALTTICFEDYTLAWLSRLAAHVSPVVPTDYLDDRGVQILLVSVISHSLVCYTRASIVRFFDLLSSWIWLWTTTYL